MKKKLLMFAIALFMFIPFINVHAETIHIDKIAIEVEFPKDGETVPPQAGVYADPDALLESRMDLSWREYDSSNNPTGVTITYENGGTFRSGYLYELVLDPIVDLISPYYDFLYDESTEIYLYDYISGNEIPYQLLSCGTAVVEHTVTFNTDGGTTYDALTVNDGEKATRPADDPIKNGYTFDDWYTDDTYTTKFDFENTPITTDTTIYAKFNEDATNDNTNTNTNDNNNSNDSTTNNTNTTGVTNDSNNPQTGDNVMFYISLLGLSIIGLAGAGLYIRKRRFN